MHVPLCCAGSVAGGQVVQINLSQCERGAIHAHSGAAVRKRENIQTVCPSVSNAQGEGDKVLNISA